MSHTIRNITIAAAVVCAVCANVTRAQESGEAPPDMAAMMAQYAELATPVAEHESFKELVGEWTSQEKMWMDPSAPPTESEATVTFRLILGGRYLIQDYTSEFMGQTFHGMGITAFDKFRQEYISLWIDDMSTGMFIARGKADSTGRTITYTGTMDDPLAGQKDIPIRNVARQIDADTQVFEMYRPGPDGKEFKMMEMTYTRKK
ncbi:MAG TPA: DUF1579 domain-containing protein [Acidobacteriota bacterium]|nr:DUF1579 domain-containing protein [Acidobacteriota bacterium]